MHQSLSFIACPLNTAQHVSGILMPIIRSLWTAVAASDLPLERGGSSAVSCGRAGRPARPRPTTLLPPRSNGDTEAATAVHKLLMMGMRMPETCWAVFKRQAIKLGDWCIWLVDLFECLVVNTSNLLFEEKYIVGHRPCCWDCYYYYYYYYYYYHHHHYYYYFAVALQPNAGHGLLILEVSRSHTTTHHSQ